MTDREKLGVLIQESFDEQYRKRGLLTAYHTEEYLTANGVTVQDATDNNVGRKWISVDDRLPEERQNVLVHYVDGWMPIAFLLGGKWYQSGGETSWLSVTHWMPLPEPPKEG